jgi:cytochrome c peroxidase
MENTSDVSCSRWKFFGLTAGLPAVLLVSSLAIGLQASDEDGKPTVPAGLGKVSHPKDNLPTAEKISLGKQLYWDKRLSKDNTISCASCHDPKKGWSNGEQFATGVDGQKGGRNSPTVLNTTYGQFQFWDGREPSLEAQAKGPIQNSIEMAMTEKAVVEKLNKIEGYKQQFQKVFGTDVTFDNLAKAIAAYERTVLAGDSPFDRYKAGDKKALSEAAERGRHVFFNKALCSACHAGSNFTDNGFHNVGIGMDKKDYDVGRFAVQKLGGNRGAFKTPTLRDIGRSAPYMHDGSLKTLEDVVEHYARGGIDNPFLSEDIFPLKLTAEEKKDLVTFLKKGLKSGDYPMHEAPKLPE